MKLERKEERVGRMSIDDKGMNEIKELKIKLSRKEREVKEM